MGVLISLHLRIFVSPLAKSEVPLDARVHIINQVLEYAVATPELVFHPTVGTRNSKSIFVHVMPLGITSCMGSHMLIIL